MTITFTYKRGVSLRFGSQLLGDDDLPVSGLGVEVSSTAKHKETGTTQVLDLVWVDRALGSFEFWAQGDRTCATWLPGTWECDVVVSIAGAAPGGLPLVDATETVNLVIEERP